MGTVRAPAVAGQFYPADPTQLTRQVDALLRAAPTSTHPTNAFVVPHAGYIYSGPTAAVAYAGLPRDTRRVVLIGPAHFAPLRGCAVASAQAWRTPLGEVRVEDASALVEAGLVTVDDDAHQREHSLEVQLPFLQRVLADGFAVLPVVVGSAAAGEVAAVISAALAPGSVLLCSTDLSHYEPDDRARVQDAATLRAIVGLRSADVGVRDACGVFALRGLLEWASSAGLTPTVLRYETSADTAGDPSRVVGYSAVAL
ncbi:AmmeMemoRadiSam system protein B [Luedemannella flava]|uniref:MEMO1 family protein GCM10009682_07680 n=1 Tax=Luedemannella flava TaxID=349316 RepID=A0ABN2LH06_9ACTN